MKKYLFLLLFFPIAGFSQGWQPVKPEKFDTLKIDGNRLHGDSSWLVKRYNARGQVLKAKDGTDSTFRRTQFHNHNGYEIRQKMYWQPIGNPDVDKVFKDSTIWQDTHIYLHPDRKTQIKHYVLVEEKK